MAKHTADVDSLVGRTIGRRRYEVVARIAQGGMAIVYRAYDRQLDRTVAIKVPRPELLGDPGFSEQFRREVRAAARLAHPNVVAIYDSGEERGLPYVVMEYVSGQNLRELLDVQGQLDVETTAELLKGVADALDHAHRAGVAHLDVKPENVLLSADSVKVADFGLVRAAQSAWGQVAAGTVQYLAPEVLRGAAVDGRADVYALGVMAYECLTGRAPFDGPDRDRIVRQHLYERVPPPSDLVPGIPEAVDAAVRRATDPDPAGRFPLASEFAAALGARRRRWTEEASRSTAEIPLAFHETMVDVPPVPQAPPRFGPGAELAPFAPVRPRPTTGRVPRVRERPPVGEPQPPSRRPRLGRLLLVLLVLVLLAGSGIAVMAAAGRTTTVPDLLGDTAEQARAELRANGLRMRLGDPVASRTRPEGQVARQSIAPGASVRRGSEVVLALSSGPPPVRVPDLAGRRAGVAETALGRLRLRVRTSNRTSMTVPRGRVIGSDPAPGTLLPEGEPVTLLVSIGKPQVAVPDVSRRRPGAAAERLRAAGFRVNARSAFDDAVPAGLVAGTDPPTGRTVDQGSVVTLIVSKGPDLVVVPAVVGLPRDRAFQVLRDAGLRPQLRFLTFGDHVTEQSIEPGRKVRRGSTVHLVLNAF